MLLLAAVGSAWGAQNSRDEKLREVRGEIRALENDLQRLRQREQGVLGELERLGGELRLRDAEYREVSTRMGGLNEEIESRERSLRALEDAQEERHRYLAFRLRELYRAGPDRTLRQFVGGSEARRYFSGLRYTSFLSERDGRVLAEFRVDTRRILGERDKLAAKRGELQSVQTELGRSRSRLRSSRQRRTQLLQTLREDQAQHQAAIAELQAAVAALTRLVDSLDREEIAPILDMRKFEGLLGWPADGPVSAGFGKLIHPKFKTEVPHPGLDIDAEDGENIRSVFAGRVVFASWMRGYGLTAIVDHGPGVMSVYAHASVLLVGPGQVVERGQTLGRVGDTGSLRGPYLYFELRVDGSPVDPTEWLRAPGE